MTPLKSSSSISSSDLSPNPNTPVVPLQHIVSRSIQFSNGMEKLGPIMATSGGIKRKREDFETTTDELPIDPAKELEIQAEQSANKLSDIEREWLKYRDEFATYHLNREEKISKTDWSDFKTFFRKNISERWDHCKAYNEDQITSEHEWKQWDLRFVVHQKYVMKGILAMLDSDVVNAIELFEKAINFYPKYLQVWLFLASALFQSREYQKVIDLAEKYIKENDGHSLNSPPRFSNDGKSNQSIFSLYSHFTTLSDACIEQNFLQLTHPIFINTEMHYYLAMARVALNRGDKKEFALVFVRRGIECGEGGFSQQAVINFEKSRELAPNILLEDHFSNALFALGKINEAMEEIKFSIEKSGKEEEKVAYLSRLVDYCIQSDQIGEADSYIEEISKDKISELSRVYITYLRAQIKLSLPNPSFNTFKKVVGQFFDHYQKLTPSQQDYDAHQWLVGCLELRDTFCKYNEAQYNIRVIIDTHELFINIFEKLIDSLEKTFIPNGKLEKEAYFPSWVEDRLYLMYFTLLMEQYLKFIDISKSSEINLSDKSTSLTMLSRYKNIKDKIKEKLANFKLRHGWYDSDESEISQAFQSLNEHFKIINILLDEGSPEDALDLGKEMEGISETKETTLEEKVAHLQELLKAVPQKTKISTIYGRTLKMIQDSEKRSFQTHSKLMSQLLGLHYWPLLIALLNRMDYGENTLINSCDEICKIIEEGLTVLTEYEAIVEKESHEILRKVHLKAIMEYRLHVFPQLAKTVLSYFNRLKKANATQLALRVVTYAEKLLTPLRTLDKQSEEVSRSERQYLDNLFKELDTALKQVGVITSQRTITEITQQLVRHPLDVIYGKENSPYRVSFPSQPIIDSLRKLKHVENVQEGKNLSVHYLTIVYHSFSLNGVKNPKKTLHYPISPPEQFFTAERLKNSNINSVDRTKRGHELYKEVPDKDKKEMKLSFKESAVKVSFTPLDHRHSEQIFFNWLFQYNLSDLIKRLESSDKDFKPGCKINMVAFDTGSSFDSCVNCRLAALSFQSGNQKNGDFLSIFEKALENKGYRLPLEKDGVKLKGVTRILAEKVRECDRINLHTNPLIKMVKHLKNLGIFQEIIPNVFASGSSHNVKK